MDTIAKIPACFRIGTIFTLCHAALTSVVRPLVIILLAGVAGGTFFGLMDNVRRQGELNHTVAILLGTIVYLIGLWLGIVMGLDGTLWD